MSFGYTESLWRFWRACGFTLVRIGSQREASSGCYAAMALLAISAAGEALQQQAAQRLARDWLWLQAIIDLPLTLVSDASQQLNEDDWALLAGFAWAQRPFEASYAALQRLVRQSPSPLLNAILLQKQTLTDAAQHAGLSGRKALINQLRSEAGAALIHLNPDAAQRLRSLQ